MILAVYLTHDALLCSWKVPMLMVCVLCDTPTNLRAIGAMIVVGDASKPDGAIVCRACAALPADEQRRRQRAATRLIEDTATQRMRLAGAAVLRR